MKSKEQEASVEVVGKNWKTTVSEPQLVSYILYGIPHLFFFFVLDAIPVCSNNTIPHAEIILSIVDHIWFCEKLIVLGAEKASFCYIENVRLLGDISYILRISTLVGIFGNLRALAVCVCMHAWCSCTISFPWKVESGKWLYLLKVIRWPLDALEISIEGSCTVSCMGAKGKEEWNITLGLA